MTTHPQWRHPAKNADGTWNKNYRDSDIRVPYNGSGPTVGEWLFYAMLALALLCIAAVVIGA